MNGYVSRFEETKYMPFEIKNKIVTFIHEEKENSFDEDENFQ